MHLNIHNVLNAWNDRLSKNAVNVICIRKTVPWLMGLPNCGPAIKIDGKSITRTDVNKDGSQSPGRLLSSESVRKVQSS